VIPPTDTHRTAARHRPPRSEADARRPRGRIEHEQLAARPFEPTPVDCAELAGLNGAAATELGEIRPGARPGRRDRDEITVYKAMGHVIADIVAAEIVYRWAAPRGGLGLASRYGPLTVRPSTRAGPPPQ